MQMPKYHDKLCYCFVLLIIGFLSKAREAGLTLPAPSTVNKYKNFGGQGSGWSRDLVEEMKNAMMGQPPRAKYGILSFDEVKIKEGLVYDPHTGELIGKKHYIITK